MSEFDEAFDALLGLREALAGYLPGGVQLEPATIGVFVAVIDQALDAYEAIRKEKAVAEMIRAAETMLGQRAVEAAGPNVFRFRRRPATVTINNGGDAA
jgi:hypothetical protein